METALAVETLARPAVRAENISPAAPCNVVILTVGWTGSSMLAGLLRAAGFWTGTTVRNTDYDTFENAELVRLNRKLLTMAGIGEGYATRFHPEWYTRVERLAHTANRSQFTAFIDDSGRHAPWLWKDPRLSVTIGFWRNLLSRNQGLLQSCLDPREKLSRTAALRPPGLREGGGEPVMLADHRVRFSAGVLRQAWRRASLSQSSH